MKQCWNCFLPTTGNDLLLVKCNGSALYNLCHAEEKQFCSFITLQLTKLFRNIQKHKVPSNFKKWINYSKEQVRQEQTYYIMNL